MERTTPLRVVQTLAHNDGDVPNTIETCPPYGCQTLPNSRKYNVRGSVGNVNPPSHDIQPTGYSGYPVFEGRQSRYLGDGLLTMHMEHHLMVMLLMVDHLVMIISGEAHLMVM